MHEPEARTGAFQHALKLADTAASGRTAGRATSISWTSASSINVLILSSADRGVTGQCLKDLSAARKVKFGGRPRRPDPCERSGPIQGTS